jgi:hypothetical protein
LRPPGGRTQPPVPPHWPPLAEKGLRRLVVRRQAARLHPPIRCGRRWPLTRSYRDLHVLRIKSVAGRTRGASRGSGLLFFLFYQVEIRTTAHSERTCFAPSTPTRASKKAHAHPRRHPTGTQGGGSPACGRGKGGRNSWRVAIRHFQHLPKNQIACCCRFRSSEGYSTIMAIL